MQKVDVLNLLTNDTVLQVYPSKVD